MSIDVAQGRKLIVRMAIGQAVFLWPAIGFAYGHFGKGVDWMLWAFVACLGGALAVQLWFISRIARMNKGA